MVHVDAVAEDESERVLIVWLVRPGRLPRAKLDALAQVQSLVGGRTPSPSQFVCAVDGRRRLRVRRRRDQLFVFSVDLQLADGCVARLSELARDLAIFSEVQIHHMTALVVGSGGDVLAIR